MAYIKVPLSDKTNKQKVLGIIYLYGALGQNPIRRPSQQIERPPPQQAAASPRPESCPRVASTLPSSIDSKLSPAGQKSSFLPPAETAGRNPICHGLYLSSSFSSCPVRNMRTNTSKSVKQQELCSFVLFRPGIVFLFTDIGFRRWLQALIGLPSTLLPRTRKLNNEMK